MDQDKDHFEPLEADQEWDQELANDLVGSKLRKVVKPKRVPEKPE